MNKKAMFDFAIEQRKMWKKTKEDVYRIAWETAKHMIYVADLWYEWQMYLTGESETDELW